MGKYVDKNVGKYVGKYVGYTIFPIPQVGLPAKSGVSGIVLVVVPNVVGFAAWSPPLDSIGRSDVKGVFNGGLLGNSARGVMFAEELVKIYNFHTFDSVSGCICVNL